MQSATFSPIDEELVSSVRHNDSRAFEELVHRYQGIVFSMSYRLLGDRVAAEDVTQEAFLQLWRTPTLYDAHRGTFRTWFLTIAHRKGVDELRRRRHHTSVSLPDDMTLEHVASLVKHDVGDDCIEQIEDTSMAQQALSLLPPAERTLVELAFIHDLSHQAIANRYRMPLGTVKTRIRRALRRLRAHYAAQAAYRAA